MAEKWSAIFIVSFFHNERCQGRTVDYRPYKLLTNRCYSCGGPGLYVNNGSLWTPLAAAPGGLPSGDDNTVLTLQGGVPVWDKLCKVGLTGPAGGKIFHCYGDFMSQGGLESANQSVQIIYPNNWGCIENDIPGLSEEVGSGASNTAIILTECSEEESAASLASDYEQNGFSDWFLPSYRELELLFMNMYQIPDLQGWGGNYASSSALGGDAGGVWYSGSGLSMWDAYYFPKDQFDYVRPVREF